MPKNRFIRAGYVSAYGPTFAVKVLEEWYDQDDGEEPPVRLIGGASLLANSNHYPLPRGMKPRRARCVGTNGETRDVILLTSTAPLATPGTEITLEDSDGADVVYTSQTVMGEEWTRIKQQPV